MIHSFIDTVDKSLHLVANCDFSVNLNSEIFFALCCSQVKHFGFGNVWSTFIQNRTLSRCFQFSGTSRVTLNVGRLQEFGVDLSTGHSFQTLLYGRSQIHVCLVDAGSLNHSKAGHHVNHLHTSIPVTTMVGQRLSLCAGKKRVWMLIKVWALTVWGLPCHGTHALVPPGDLDTASLHHLPTYSCRRHGPWPHSSQLWY